MQRREQRALLDGELIEREMMVLLLVERLGELLAPGAKRLPLPRIDQVEGHALEIALGDGERGQRLLAVCLRPSAFRLASSSDCTPSDTRLTPAAR